MKVGPFLAAADALPIMPLDQALGGGGLVVVAPHPDDESLGCGGMIAAARAAGRAVWIVVLSDGVGSHPNSRAWPPARLRARREAETLDAAAALGLGAEAVTFVGLPDRAVPDAGPDAERGVAAMADACRAVSAGAVCVTWRHDPHCDHGAAARLAAAARPRLGGASVWEYPIWGWTLPPETEVGGPPAGLRLDVGPFLPAKRNAIAAHRSQVSALIDDDPSGFRLEPAMIEHFLRGHEILLEPA